MGVEGADSGNGVLIAVDCMESALQEIASVNQLSFIAEYRKCIGLGILGANPNLH